MEMGAMAPVTYTALTLDCASISSPTEAVP